MTQYEQVTEVVDGDTFKTANFTVRLEGVDTPERGQPGYAEAINAIRNLIWSKIVYIYIRTYDRYGRAIAQVWGNRAMISLSLLGMSVRIRL